MKAKRKILFISGSRGEYGYIRPLLRCIESDLDLEYSILATNMHLLPEFGDSLNQFYNDGFKVDYKPLMTLSGYTPASMVKSLSVLGLSLPDIFDHYQPDIILLAGDRGEQLIAAIAGSHMNVPVAHIQAGEISGNIDGLSRHAIARFSHIHFASNEDAENRLLKSGEQPFRVFNVGAPQLDEFIEGKITDLNTLKNKYKGVEYLDYILFVQHSVTEQFNEAYSQVALSLSVLRKLGKKTIVISPNSDAGSSFIKQAIEDNHFPGMFIYKNVSREDYAGLMKNACCLVGNSSSGILEAPTFKLPSVNIGRRQTGRYQGHNVINCDHNFAAIENAILKACSSDFRNSISNMVNPYGDGNSSKRIIEVLKNIELNEKLLMKQLSY